MRAPIERVKRTTWQIEPGSLVYTFPDALVVLRETGEFYIRDWPCYPTPLGPVANLGLLRQEEGWDVTLLELTPDTTQFEAVGGIPNPVSPKNRVLSFRSERAVTFGVEPR